MSDVKAKARGLLAARAVLAEETQRLNKQRREGQARTRQRRRRKRIAEQLAADMAASKTLPALVNDARRRAKLVLGLTTLPAILSTRELSDLETTLSHRIKTGGQRGKATYWSMIGKSPECEPGDTTSALIYYRRIMNAIDSGGWSTVERAALHVLAKRWLARAQGKDARFMEVGTRGAGRLPSNIEAKIRSRR